MSKKIKISFLYFLSLFVLGYARVPSEVNYQGVLREYGQPANGQRMARFDIYNHQTTGALVWSSGDVLVNVSTGVFNYTLSPNIDLRNGDYWIETTIEGKTFSPRQKITAQFYALHSRTAEDVSKSSGTIYFSVGTSTQMIITSDGNLVLGSTAAAARLTVNYSATGNGGLEGLRLNQVGSGGCGISFDRNGALTGLWQIYQLQNNNFAIGRNSVSDFITVSTVGNVGIGTGLPEEKLVVNGVLSLAETTLPSATANYGKILVRSLDNHLVYINENGDVLDLSAIASGGVSGSGSSGQIAYFSGSNAISGNNNFFWDDINKRLGLNTTTPTERLDIGDGNIRIRDNYKLKLRSSGDETYIGWTTAEQLRISNVKDGADRYIQLGGTDNSNNWSPQLTLNTKNGNVGINTTTPSGKLHINSDTDNILFWDTPSTSFGGSKLYYNNIMSGSNSDLTFITNLTGTNKGGYAFYVDSGTSINFAMGIDSLGRIGIGTTNPETEFQVNGSIANALIFGKNSSGVTKWVSGTINKAGDWVNDSSPDDIFVRQEDTSKKMYLAVGPEAKMTLTNTDVRVNGDISLSGLKISQSGTGFQLDINPYHRLRFGRHTNNDNFYVAVMKGNNEDIENHRLKGNGNSFLCSNNGYLGIGTTNPYDKLDVVDGNIRIRDNYKYILRNTGADTYVGFYEPLTQLRISSAKDGYDRYIQLGGTDSSNNWNPQLTLNTKNGYVGIGISTPSENLHIYQDGAITSDATHVIIQNPNKVSSIEGRAILQMLGGDNNFRIDVEHGTDTNIRNAGNYPLVFSTNGSERVRITGNGNVGIGTQTPEYKLDVWGGMGRFNGSSYGSGIIIGQDDGSNYYIQCNYASRGIRFQTNGNRVCFDDKVGVGTTGIDSGYAFQILNNSSYKAKAYAWDTYSDDRVKLEQKKLEYGLKEILALQPKRYRQHNAEFINGQLVLGNESQNNIGFVAQDVYNTIPEAVNKPKDENNEFWGLDYTKIIPVLVNAIQEQQKKIEQLEAKIKELERK